MASKRPASSSAVGTLHLVPYTNIFKLCNNTNILIYDGLLKCLAE
jgi:hypothetical protein